MNGRIIAPTKDRRCGARGCGRFAICTLAVVLVSPAGNWEKRARTTLRLCDRHKRTIRLDDIYTRDGWARQIAPWLTAGKPPPDYAASRLEFEDLPTIPERAVRPS